MSGPTRLARGFRPFARGIALAMAPGVNVETSDSDEVSWRCMHLAIGPIRYLTSDGVEHHQQMLMKD